EGIRPRQERELALLAALDRDQDVARVRLVAGAAEHLDQVEAVRRQHRLADAPERERPDGLLERRRHDALAEGSEVAALGGRARIGRLTPGDLGEVRAGEDLAPQR